MRDWSVALAVTLGCTEFLMTGRGLGRVIILAGHVIFSFFLADDVVSNRMIILITIKHYCYLNSSSSGT